MKAKKSLGQHFLTSKRIIARIITAAEISTQDTVLEIGPGKGALTEELLKYAGKVVAVEKDNALIPYLKEKFAKQIELGTFILVEGDALLFDPARYQLRDAHYTIVANIPYYITGQFFRRFLEKTSARPRAILVMTQKEVAERIVARPARAGGDRKESILSISVKVYGTPSYIMKVSAREFKPQPKVDSAILYIKNISNQLGDKEKTAQFFSMLKRGFAHKRKLLKRNLNVSLATLATCNIESAARAENLSLENWLCLAKYL